MTQGPGVSRRLLLSGALAATGLVAASCGLRDHPEPEALAGPGPAVPQPSPTGVVATGVEHGPRDRREVALTLHGSGDQVLLRQMLSVCERGQAPMTVFAVGQWLADTPGVARRVLDGGHELGNHTWSGGSTPRQTPLQLRGEIVRTREVLVRQTGSPGVAFRPVRLRRPTPLVLREAGAAGYRDVVTEDVDPADSAGATAAQIALRVRRTVQPGSVLSLSITASTLQALPQLLADLRTARLTPVSVTRLLGRPGS